MAGMRDDLIELSRTIDPAILGDRLRSARLRVGLTQAQVAGDTVSVGYISRIESGNRRPDPALLETLAGRLGVDVEEILIGVAPDRALQLRVELDHAELALATGSPAAALEPLARILVDPATEPLPEVRRRASYLRAQALEATGDLQGAILTLEDLTEAGPRDLEWLNGVTALCRCYREAGELGRAIEVGNLGTTFVEEHDLGGLDDAIRLTLNLSAAYVEQGDVGYATRMCRRAIERAEETASSEVKASAYWNVSIIEAMRGNAELALQMSQRALAVLDASDDMRNAARLRTELGIQQLLVDPPMPSEALANLRRSAHELEVIGAAAGDLADNRLAQARAHFLLGQLEMAGELARQSASAEARSAPIIAANAQALLGQIAVSEGELTEARSHFQEAATTLTRVGADRAAAQLWFELGSLLEAVGEPSQALDAYRRAGASTGLSTPTHPQLRAEAAY